MIVLTRMRSLRAEAIKDVDQVEALGALGIIDRGEIDQIIEIVLQLQKFENRDDGRGFGDQKILPEVGGEFGDLCAEALLERRW